MKRDRVLDIMNDPSVTTFISDCNSSYQSINSASHHSSDFDIRGEGEQDLSSRDSKSSHGYMREGSFCDGVV